MRLKSSMKKIFITTIVFGLLTLSFADGLSHSLNSLVHTKDNTPNVNLDNLSLNARPRVVHKKIKTRSKNAVVATVNGINVIKRDADKHLSRITKGKIKNFDRLTTVQKRRLIKDISLPIVAYVEAKKSLTQEEIDAVISRVWIQKRGQTIKVADEEALKAYDTIKKDAISKNQTDKLPPFEAIKNNLKGQIVQKKVMASVMKDANITINY